MSDRIKTFQSEDNVNTAMMLNPGCPYCFSPEISGKRSYEKTLDKRSLTRMQRFKCDICEESLETKPPGYGYGKHLPSNMRKRGWEHGYA